MQSITNELLNQLKNASDIESFFKAHEDKFLNKSTSDYLNELIQIKNINISVVAKDSGAGEYVYKIFKGDRKPSRDVLLSIAFGMKLSLEETQFLLRLSKFAILDSRDKRDSTIIYAIMHDLSVFQLDDVLDNNGLTTLN